MRESHLNKYGASQAFTVQGKWSVINGYAATITNPEVLRALLEESDLINWIEQDQIMTASQDSVQTQTGLPAGLWGLTRVWQRTRTSTTTYQYWSSAGANIDCYIVDTGLNPTHVDYTGRTAAGASFVTDTNWPGTADGNGHGTHVASTVAGTTYGIAKRCTIIPVKVLSAAGSGTNAGVINGVDWVRTTRASRGRPGVANMSLGGGASAALDNAVNSAAATVAFVVAAGNENQNACNVSPARATGAITVGSTTNTDARSSFSNFGTCVDVFAPGSNILGAWYGSTTATNTISGTSMASPHVAGAVALILGRSSGLTPAQIRTTLNSRATLNVVTSPGTGSPNRLLFTSTTE